MESRECPACGGKLQGTRFTGFQCGRCRSHFSARFMAQVRRRHFREMIIKHFDTPKSPRELPKLPEPVLDRDDRIEEVLDQAHIAVHNIRESVVQHLEEIVGPAETMHIAKSVVRKKAKEKARRKVQRPVKKVHKRRR